MASACRASGSVLMFGAILPWSPSSAWKAGQLNGLRSSKSEGFKVLTVVCCSYTNKKRTKPNLQVALPVYSSHLLRKSRVLLSRIVKGTFFKVLWLVLDFVYVHPGRIAFRVSKWAGPELGFHWVLVKEFNSRYHNKENILHYRSLLW